MYVVGTELENFEIEQRQGKRVQFSDEVRVRYILHWSFAHQLSRRGDCWIQNTVDRERFQRRIRNLALIIEPVLVKKISKT